MFMMNIMREQKIRKIVQGYQQSITLMTAAQLKVFDLIAVGPLSAEKAAQELGLSCKGVERLFNALVAMGIVLKDDGEFHLPGEWQSYLKSDGSHSLCKWIQLSSDLLSVWTQQAEFVKTGKPVRSIMRDLKNDPKKMRTFIGAMHEKALTDARLLASEIPLKEARRMLDAGGGPGTYALEWAQENPQLEAVIFDIPPVLNVTREYIVQYGLGNRVRGKAGDLHKDDLGSGYDLVLLANVLHMYKAERARDLLQKCVIATQSGGRIIVQGFCTEAEDTAPQGDVFFNLNVGMLTAEGRAHPVREIIQWMEAAGVAGIRYFRIQGHSTGVFTGTKTYQ